MPWKFLGKGTDLVKGPIVLYWLPASTEEINRSPLLASRRLLEAASRCVEFEIVTPDDSAAIDKLGGSGKLPMAVLAGRQGKVIRSAGNVRGALPASAVERMLDEELSARDDSVYRDLTEAKREMDAGQTEKAIDLYREIWDDRCLYPLIGSEAQRSLKELGVIVHDTPAPPPADPNLKVTLPSSRQGRP